MYGSLAYDETGLYQVFVIEEINHRQIKQMLLMLSSYI